MYELPLEVYFDEFEPNNPLGSHNGEQKIGAVYTKFACLPEYMASKISSVISASLIFTEDWKKFGNARIFNPLIEELKYLENVFQ